MKGRILAIDYGLKRIGLALSDERQILASPFDTLEGKKNPDKDAQSILPLLQQKQVVKILIGLPLHLDGRESDMSQLVKKFQLALEKLCDTPIELVDERLTSKMAENLLREQGFSRKKRSQKVDPSSACIFLQNYLDQKSFS